MNKQKLTKEKLDELRGISKQTYHSIDRNIRACYPNKSEKEIEQMVIKNIKDNLDSCKDF